MKHLLFLALLAGGLAVGNPALAGGAKVKSVATSPRVVEAWFKTAAEKLQLKPFPVVMAEKHHIGLLPDGRLVLVTGEFARPSGLRGPTILAMVLDAEGKVAELVVVESADDPPWVKRVTAQLPELQNQGVTTRARPVLAVSRATYSSKGFTGAVNGTLDAVAPLHARLRVTEGKLCLDGTPLKTVFLAGGKDGKK